MVTQQYLTETHNNYAIIGNSALLKCEIPSFVADFVTVDSWTDNNGNEYFSESSNNYGKHLNRSIQSLVVHHKGSNSTRKSIDSSSIT